MSLGKYIITFLRCVEKKKRYTALHMRLIDTFRMLTVVALSVSAREEKIWEILTKFMPWVKQHNSMLHFSCWGNKLLWAMAVWFWKYYDCLNITYDSYSPTAHPLIKRFKMVGEMKTRELALDVLVADIWEGGDQWDQHKGSECQSLHLKDWRYKFDRWWPPALPFKKVSLSLCTANVWICSAPASEMTFICICLKALVVNATEWCRINIKKTRTFWFTAGGTAVADSWQEVALRVWREESHYPPGRGSSFSILSVTGVTFCQNMHVESKGKSRKSKSLDGILARHFSVM